MTEDEYNRVSNLAILRTVNSALREVFFFKQPARTEKRNQALIAIGELIDELWNEHDSAKRDTP